MRANPIAWEGMELPVHVQSFLAKQPIRPLMRRLDGRLAVIIAYRDRSSHLKKLLPSLKKALSGCCTSYSICIAEQADRASFNKGALYNAAVKAIGEKTDYLCFHDVDFLPVSADYCYASQPLRPFSSTIGHKTYLEEFNLKKLEEFTADQKSSLRKKEAKSLVYPHFFGGVILVPTQTFLDVKGFSGSFRHWGFEDLDFLLRCFSRGHTPYADPNGIFLLQDHPHAISTRDKEIVLKNFDRYSVKSKDLDFKEDEDPFEVIEFQREKDYIWLKISSKTLKRGDSCFTP